MDERYYKEDIFRLLRVLSSENTLSQRDLSVHLDISLGKTNFLIKTLLEKGFIQINDRTNGSKNMRIPRYVLTQAGTEEQLGLGQFFLRRKETEYLKLKNELKNGY